MGSYLITAGGTGGHINPGVLIAKELVSNGNEVIFVFSQRAVDHIILDNEDTFTSKFFKMSGFEREITIVSIFKNIRNIWRTMIVFIQIIYLFLKFKPDYVIGMGGFISYPVIKIAKLFKVKVVIHEQNSYPGVVNRKLCSQVDKVFYTYQASTKYFTKAKKLVYTGNPRGELAKTKRNSNKNNEVLFIGGSLGAEAINKIAVEYAIETKQKTTLICGQRYINKLTERSSNLNLIEYADDLVERIAMAQIVVTRGGATTLLECINALALTIVIPSPNVVGDHQTKNAQELEKLGLLKIIEEDNLNLVMLKSKINEVLLEQDILISKMNDYSEVKTMDLIMEELI